MITPNCVTALIYTTASQHDVFYHIDLIHMTNDPRVSMPVMADLLADRLRINNWVVAFKALITSHNLMTLGNEVITMVTMFC